jgi:uncharacterized membrane protein YeaQ/YmgE (transglycosylase-associated protein family)
MGLCSWIVFGFFAGLLARAVMPGTQKMGFIKTTLLGVAGAFVGGALVALLTHGNFLDPHRTNFLGAVAGAFVLLLVGRLLDRGGSR